MPKNVYGTYNDDIIKGTEQNDTIYGAPENSDWYEYTGLDIIYGYGGNDIIWTGRGSTDVYAGAGNDYIFTLGNDRHRIYGEGGNDIIRNNTKGSYLFGGDGDDIFDGSDESYYDGGSGSDTIEFTRGSYEKSQIKNIEYLRGTETDESAILINPSQINVFKRVDTTVNADGTVGKIDFTFLMSGTVGSNFASNISGYITFLISSGSADISLSHSKGSWRANTFDGNDKIKLGAGADLVFAGQGNDYIDGGAGIDVLYGEGGNDTYRVDHAADRVIEAAGGGRDTVITTVSYRLAAGQQIEVLQTADTNGKAALSLTGNAFTNKLIGNAGNNVLDGGAGIDEMRGGAGGDTYLVDNARDIVFEAVGGGTDTVLASVGYTLKAGQEIENLRLTSKAGSVALTGNEFGQTLVGNVGANVLDGGLGADVLTGGKGADTFVFSTALGAGNVDRIADFSAVDTIRLSKSLFLALAPDELKANEFKDIAKGKVDADDHVLYDSRDGSLFYDADGSGKAAAVKFAVLDNKAAITHADFLIA